MAEDSNQTQYVRSGWSSFWRWTGTIVVVLILAIIVIYVANTFLLGESMRSQAISDAATQDQPDAQIKLDITGSAPEKTAPDAGQTTN